MNKDKIIQAAIVCLYLRKRRARHYRDKFIRSISAKAPNPNQEINLAALRAAETEAHNALESLKRVLWHTNWT